jgi:HlyD family secretion protein
MNATVAFYNDAETKPSGETKMTVVVPSAAIQNGSVFQIVNGKVVKRSVTSGATTTQGVVVEGGLIGGEDLVLNPPADLKDGQRVEIKK